MAKKEEIIGKKYQQISSDLNLTSFPYAEFLKKLKRISNNENFSSVEELVGRDLTGIYLALGAELGITDYIDHIYRNYRSFMLRAAFHFFPRDEATAEDVVHDVFSRIKWESFRGTGSLKGWLQAVIANHCLDVLRKQKHTNVGIEKLRLVSLANPESGTILSECRKKLHDSVQKALDEITPHEKNLLTFSYIEGVTVRALAGTYGKSPATMVRLLRSARDCLREAVIRYAHEKHSMTEDEIEGCLELIFRSEHEE